MKNLVRVLNHPALWAAILAVAIPLITNFEGMALRPYRDVVGVPTVCVGATAADGVDLHRSYTKAECEAMLAADLPKYEEQVEKCVVVPMPPHRHAAILSFTYNVGGSALCRSSVARYLNAGNVTAGCNALLEYDHAGGRVIKGLTTRRIKERQLCLMED